MYEEFITLSQLFGRFQNANEVIRFPNGDELTPSNLQTIARNSGARIPTAAERPDIVVLPTTSRKDLNNQELLAFLDYFTDFGGSPQVNIETEPTPEEDLVDVVVDVNDEESGLFTFLVGAGSDSGLFGGASINKRNFDITRAPSSFTPAKGAAISTACRSPQPVAPISSSGMPPIARGSPTARPISSCTQPMQASSVPMSGPKM